MSTKDNGRARTALSRREFLRLAGLGGGATLLAACGGTPAAPGADATAAPAEPAAAVGGGDKVAITFWEPGGGGAFCEMFDMIAEDFEKSHPTIDIGQTQCHSGEQDFNELLLARIAAGNPPDATVLWTSPAALGARGSLTPLDELMQRAQYANAENWPPGVLASCQFDGKTWGLPVTSGTYAMWYSQTMFENKGIPTDRKSFPKTWDELRRLSKEFTHWNGDTLETIGFLPWHGVQAELYIWSALNGSQLYDAANKKYTINSEPNIAMMQYGLDWVNEEYKGDWALLNRSSNWEGYDMGDGRPVAMIEGRQAIMIMGAWGMNGAGLVRPAPPEGTPETTEMPELGGNVAQLPVGPNGSKPVSGYWPNWFVIPQGSKNVEQAFAWLDYMSGEGVATWFTNIPDMPANQQVVRDLLPSDLVEAKGKDFAQEIMEFFRAQLDITVPMWNSPIQNFADDQLTRAVERIYNKAATPKEAMEEAQTACQNELDKVLKQGS